MSRNHGSARDRLALLACVGLAAARSPLLDHLRHAATTTGGRRRACGDNGPGGNTGVHAGQTRHAEPTASR